MSLKYDTYEPISMKKGAELVPVGDALTWLGLEEVPPVPVDPPTHNPFTALLL